MQTPNHSALARDFAHAADNQYSGIGATASPLYAALARAVALDPDMLALAAHVPAGQPVSNLLFSSIYYLLLSGIAHPAAAYFAGVAANPLPADAAYPAVRDFCQLHRQKLIPMLQTRRVQTNEAQRSAIWLPAFEHIAQQTARRPLAMLEIGASAGLNLHWDRHFYRYDARSAGDSAATLQLTCTVNGAMPPPLPQQTLPVLAWRCGIDLNPIDIHDDDAVAWLRALIWPEQHHRVEMLKRAAEVARANPVTIHRGDAAALLPGILAQVPRDLTLCLCHSFTWNQCPPDVRDSITQTLERASTQRDIYRLSYEWLGERPMLELHHYAAGRVTTQTLAHVDSHGRHIEWL